MKPFFLMFIWIFWSCNDQNAPIQMSSIHRDKADTIYLEKISGLRDSLDSACLANFEIEVQKAMDSIIEIRKIDEKNIRMRIQNNGL